MNLYLPHLLSPPPTPQTPLLTTGKKLKKNLNKPTKQKNKNKKNSQIEKNPSKTEKKKKGKRKDTHIARKTTNTHQLITSYPSPVYHIPSLPLPSSLHTPSNPTPPPPPVLLRSTTQLTNPPTFAGAGGGISAPGVPTLGLALLPPLIGVPLTSSHLRPSLRLLMLKLSSSLELAGFFFPGAGLPSTPVGTSSEKWQNVRLGRIGDKEGVERMRLRNSSC